MRPTLAKCLIEAASEREDIMFLTADLGFGVFDEFKKRFPNRYINVGIAEAGMVTVAAGLSAGGFTPIIYSIASFLLPKSYEQLRHLLAYNENRIILIGAGGGLTYSMSGPSHHSLDDLSLALLLPRINVYCPSGPESLKSILDESLNSKVSSYIQIGKSGEPNIPKHILVEQAQLGLITCGVIANEVYEIHKTLLQNNIASDFIIVESLRPFKVTEILEFIRRNRILILIEESWSELSLYSIVVRLLHESRIDSKIIRIGPPHKILKNHLERSSWLQEFGLSYDNIIKLIE